MDLSVVIPVWNEAAKISKDLTNLDSFLNSQSIDAEIIIVDDGSTDKTCTIIESFQKKLSSDIELITKPIHQGKGSTVRTGILRANGNHVMFMDCGGNVPLEYIIHGMQLLNTHPNQLVHGSRKLSESKIIEAMSHKRQFLSWLFRVAANFLLDLPPHLTDSQCGYKFYNRHIANKLYEQPVLDGFLFDLEIILRAHKAGIQIIEFPIHWSCDPDSRLHPGKIIPQVIKDLLYLRNKY